MRDYLSYLKKDRTLSVSTIQRFCLGYRDETGHNYIQKHFPKSLLNMLNDSHNDSVLFPVFNLYGEPIAISARKFDGQPRYRNTSFSKTSNFYGLNETYKEILKAKEVFVVEGNVDFLYLFQSGIRNVVGLLGSNLTFKQVCLLVRFAEKLIIVPDGDEGGEKFRKRVKKFLSRTGVDFLFINLPEEYDPDKFVREYGKEKFLELRNKGENPVKSEIYG